MDLKITLSSGKDFTAHDPAKLNYFMAYATRADFISYEVGLYNPLDITPTDEATFEIIPSLGDTIKFTGVLYNVRTLGKANHVRLLFVSKYFPKIMSAEPLFGRGKTSDIIDAFYRKTGIKQVTKDPSDVTIDNIVFPRTTRIDDAISYLYDRSTATDSGYLVGTIIGDRAYIRNIKKGREDIRGEASEDAGGLHYQPVRIRDDRRRVDTVGGISDELNSDSEDINTQLFTSKGSKVTLNKTFTGINDKLTAKAKVRVAQLRKYYTSYTAVLNVLGATPLIGANIIVDKKDINSEMSWYRVLDKGKYFINTQIVTFNFKDASAPSSRIGVQLVG